MLRSYGLIRNYPNLDLLVQLIIVSEDRYMLFNQSKFHQIRRFFETEFPVLSGNPDYL